MERGNLSNNQIQLPICEGFARQFRQRMLESKAIAKRNGTDPNTIGVYIKCRECPFFCIADLGAGEIDKSGDKRLCVQKTDPAQRANKVYTVFPLAKGE